MTRSTIKYQSILKEASRLFARNPFEKVTMEAIARYANVSKVTLYKHFSNKLTLYEHLIKMQMEKEREFTRNIVTDLIPYETKLKKLFNFYLERKMQTDVPTLDTKLILSLDMTKYIKNHKAKMKRLREKLYNEGRMNEYLPMDCSDSFLETLFFTIVEGLQTQSFRYSRMNPDEKELLFSLIAKPFLKW
jgi:AcrR family transcriptional regulator